MSAFREAHTDEAYCDYLRVHAICLHDGNEYGRPALIYACENGYLKSVKYLIASNTYTRQQNISIYECPLYHACAGQFPECIKALIDAGAYVNPENEDMSPIATLVYNYDVSSRANECIKILIEAGANIHTTIYDNTLFECVCDNCLVSYAQILIEAGCWDDGEFTEAIIESPIIGQVLFAIDCYEAKKEQHAQQLASIKRASDY